MNDSNATTEVESMETVGIWRRAVSSELTFGGQRLLPNDSTCMIQQELSELHHDE